VTDDNRVYESKSPCIRRVVTQTVVCQPDSGVGQNSLRHDLYFLIKSIVQKLLANFRSMGNRIFTFSPFLIWSYLAIWGP
jgi:hypothetical protein